MGKGIDVSRVNLVINFDFSISEKDYVHRIARAGRFEVKKLKNLCINL